MKADNVTTQREKVGWGASFPFADPETRHDVEFTAGDIVDCYRISVYRSTRYVVTLADGRSFSPVLGTCERGMVKAIKAACKRTVR